MTNTQELTRQSPKTGPWIIGYAISVAAAFAITGSGLITNPAIGMMLWIPVAICLGMIVYTSWRRHRIVGTVSPASRKFWRRLVAAVALGFVGLAVSGVVWTQYGYDASGTNLLGMLPYLGLVGIVWCIHQYIADEDDEYLRWQAVRQTLIAGCITLIIAALWGGLAYSGLLPAGWVGMTLLIWLGGLGIGQLYNEMRA